MTQNNISATTTATRTSTKCVSSVNLNENNNDDVNTTARSSTGQMSTFDRTFEMQIAADFVEKIHNLKYVLNADLIACDARWTLFVAAALSFRYDSQLKPFPPRFSSEQAGYNIDALANVIKDTPKLSVVLQNIVDENYDDLDTEVVDLLHWVLVTSRDPYLRSVEKEEYDLLMSKIAQHTETAHPTHVFEVCPTVESKSEEIFTKAKGEFSTKLAFHGSKLDSFYSIINHGLHQHMCKNGLFGEGSYLSTELAVSLHFSPNGAGWGASSCGSMISCVAVCEYVENPEYVKRKEDKKSTTDLPNTYIVINNNDVVRVRYLLFYGSCFPDENSPKGILLRWIDRHKYLLSLACYTLFLTSIGFANSGGGVYLRHLISKKASYILGCVKKIFIGE